MRRQAFEVCEAHVKDWAPSYAHHTELVREEAGISIFRTIWSKPTKSKPISEMIAGVEVIVDLSGDTPVVSHRLDAGFHTFTWQLRVQEAQIDRHIADKRAVRDVLAHLNTAERLPRPQPYRRGDASRAAPPAGADVYTPDARVVVPAIAEPMPSAAEILTESDAQLEEVLVKLFHEADVDGSGSLDMGEFFSLFQTARLGLSHTDVAFLLASADVSGDGLVQYAEFAPVAVDVIQSLRLRSRSADAVARSEERATDKAVTTLYGLEREELEGLMKAVFVASDENGDGMLSRAEFAACLERVRLGPTRLSKREIRFFQAAVTLDEEGRVSYEAFVPIMWDLLVETVKSNLLASSQGETYEYLRDLCISADSASVIVEEDEEDEHAAERHVSGKLSRDELKRVLLHADRIKLTPVQTYVVLAEADDDEDGRVEYGAFLLRAVPLIVSMCSPILEKQRLHASERAKLTPIAVLGETGREGLSAKLRAVFERYDADSDGVLSRAEFGDCLRNTELQLSSSQMGALFLASDSNEDGSVSIDEFTQLAYDVLFTLAREKALQEEIASDNNGSEPLGGAFDLLVRS